MQLDAGERFDIDDHLSGEDRLREMRTRRWQGIDITEFAGRHDPDLRAEAVLDENLSADLLDDLVQDPVTKIRTRVAALPQITEDHVAALAADEDAHVRLVVAGRHYLTAETEAALAADVVLGIRCRMAQRDHLEQATVELLLDDASWHVRQCIAQRSDLNSRQAERLAHDDQYLVLRALMQHPRTANVIRVVLKRLSDKETFTKMLSEDHFRCNVMRYWGAVDELLGKQAVPGPQLREMIELLLAKPDNAGGEFKMRLLHMLASEASEPAELSFAIDACPETQIAELSLVISQNPCASPAVLERLAHHLLRLVRHSADESYLQAWKALLSHPGSNHAALSYMIDMIDHFASYQEGEWNRKTLFGLVLRHHALDISHVHQIASISLRFLLDGPKHVQSVYADVICDHLAKVSPGVLDGAFSARLSPDLLTVMARTSNKYVRRAAAGSFETPDHDLLFLMTDEDSETARQAAAETARRRAASAEQPPP